VRAPRILIALGAVLCGYSGYVAWRLPSRAEIRALAHANPRTTSVMHQREEEARDAHRKLRHEQSWVPLSRVARSLIQAVIVAEDPKFFGHGGIDWDAIKESAETDWKRGGFVRGGSTITQQVAKNVFFTTRKSLTRKLMEVVVARQLEADLSKRRILEIYLNVIEWGDGIYGCEAAARSYYGKPAADLDEDEAAGLAGMIPSPKKINPRVNSTRFARAQRRVLFLMAHAGYVKRDIGSLGTERPSFWHRLFGGEDSEQDEAAEPTPTPGVR
jgi:monofunctional biosynthetic peptidoglycan transglycosylase